MTRKCYEISERTARTAHEIMYMRDYVEGSTTAEYKRLVDRTYEIDEQVAEKRPNEAERAFMLAERFSRKMAENINSRSRIGCMCPSVLISGANFPMCKKQKQNKASDKNMAEYNEIMGIREKLERILYGKEIIKFGDKDAIEKLEANLKDLQGHMKAVNAYYRKHKTLDNCSELTENGTQGSENEFIKVVENVEIMRLQLIFDGKSEEEVRNVLKSHGFRWSRKEGAWQQQLTANAKYSLKSILR